MKKRLSTSLQHTPCTDLLMLQQESLPLISLPRPPSNPPPLPQFTRRSASSLPPKVQSRLTRKAGFSTDQRRLLASLPLSVTMTQLPSLPLPVPRDLSLNSILVERKKVPPFLSRLTGKVNRQPKRERDTPSSITPFARHLPRRYWELDAP